MTSTLQKLALQSYTHLPASVTPGPGKQLKAVNEAVNSAARDAAEAANSVIDRMRNNGWYGVASSPTGRDSASSEDDYQASSPFVSKSRSRVKSPSVAHDRDTSDTGDASAGEGWKIWQGAYDRVKWQSVNDKVKDVAAAVKKKYAGNDGLCDSDEEDFAGPGDSHLIRIMKEYYIDNSRSQADLPAWLFPEVDRHDNIRAWEDVPPSRPSGGRRSKSRSQYDDDPYGEERGSRSRGYRDRDSYDRDDRYDSNDRYNDRPYRSTVPSAYANPGDPSPRRSSGSSSSTSASRLAESSRLRPSEHGSRTAEKLARMKGARNM